MARITGKGIDFNDVLMVPKYNKVRSREHVNLETRLTRNYKMKLPIISANMDTITESDMAIALGNLGGLGVIHRFMDIDKQLIEVTRVKQKNLLTAVAIGVKDFEYDVGRHYFARTDILVLDIAHGHSKYAGKAVEYIKSKYPEMDVIAGNIATKDAAEYFLSKGADAVKVGIGPGFACTTRRQTGVGVPQLTAIMDVYEAIQGEIPIIADGGIREPGDLAKAIGAGADSIMSGYIFAGCDETPPLGRNIYRGSASFDTGYIEGREVEVESKGPIKNVVDSYTKGLRSAITYNGKDKLTDFVGRADFILK